VPYPDPVAHHIQKSCLRHNTPCRSCGLWETKPKESRELPSCQSDYPAISPHFSPAVNTQTYC
jgi:hypothetical protein